MQTFLPYPDFEKTAEILDNKRLGKQRVEAYQILKTLEGRSKGWINHPVMKMWKGSEEALKQYFNVIAREWIRRDFKHNMGFYEIGQVIYPSWLGVPAFHDSHKSNLLRKDSIHYSIWSNLVSDNLPYVWPTNSISDRNTT